jgi:hypothetical protein
MGAAEIRDGREIEIGSASNELAITLTESATSWARVSGRVIGAEFLPPGSRQVVLSSGMTLLRELVTQLDSEGRFEFPKVPPAQYTARLRQGPLASTAADVSVSAEGVRVSNVALTVAPQISFGGRLIVPKGSQPEPFTMTLADAVFAGDQRSGIGGDVAICYIAPMANGIPVRLSEALTARARTAAAALDRSLTEQVEHWARLGQVVEEAILSATAQRLKERSHDPKLAKRLAFANTDEGQAKAARVIRQRNPFRHETTTTGGGRAARAAKREAG